MSFPENMYQHWIEVSGTKNSKLINVKEDQKYFQNKK
jgi:hypothetical protein